MAMEAWASVRTLSSDGKSVFCALEINEVIQS